MTYFSSFIKSNVHAILVVIAYGTILIIDQYLDAHFATVYFEGQTFTRLFHHFVIYILFSLIVTYIFILFLKLAHSQRLLSKQKHTLATVLDNLPEAAYVIDPQNYHLLFVNPVSQHLIFKKKPINYHAPCYFLFHGRTKPCSFCQIPNLSQQNPSITWERYFKRKQKYFLNYDKLITWTEGQSAILKLSIDMTSQRQAQKQINRLSQQLLHSQETEKMRLSREIHDTISQDLAALKMHLQSVNQQISLPEMKRYLDTGITRLVRIIDTSKHITNQLRPHSLDVLGLVDTVDELIHEYQTLSKIQFTIAKPEQELRLSKHVETELFRMLQEALFNIVKHSQSPRAQIAFHLSDNLLNIVVTDYGHGFNPDVPKQHHFGLHILKERAKLIQADLQLTSSKQGTQIVINLPL